MKIGRYAIGPPKDQPHAIAHGRAPKSSAYRGRPEVTSGRLEPKLLTTLSADIGKSASVLWVALARGPFLQPAAHAAAGKSCLSNSNWGTLEPLSRDRPASAFVT